jgi:hypothetical protein
VYISVVQNAATGHLLYSFWHLFLKDLGLVTAPIWSRSSVNQDDIEPVKKLCVSVEYKLFAG